MKGQKSLVWLAAALLALPLSALEVDEAELKNTGGNDSIVFVNYTGPHARIDSLASIKRLGADLGAPVAGNAAQPRTAGTSDRYSVIHAVDPAETTGLDADIIVIGSGATVDHVDNLRHIIAAYLTAAYGYSERDASTLAVFATVYNAVYRGNLGYFQGKYKQAVLSHLDAQNCGLALNYKEWPGRTQIVIPLYDVARGGISTVDTSVISDTQVVKRMQDDEDKNIESRKDMVDLKEREAEEASERAQEAQKTAVEEQSKLDEEKQKTEELRKEAEAAKEAADEAQKEADEAQKAADENPDDRQAQQEAAEKQEAAAEKQEELEQKQEELERQEAAEEEQRQRAEEAQQEAAGQQEFADRKNAEAQDERRNIAGDQQAVIRQEIENAAAPATYAIELTDESSMLSGMIKV
ncbi:MAG: hypothetical protein K2H09_02485, partial [Treponemataceae bacterium]|nr:hypothetical protein [Treponemataceae bacterium]